MAQSVWSTKTRTSAPPSPPLSPPPPPGGWVEPSLGGAGPKTFYTEAVRDYVSLHCQPSECMHRFVVLGTLVAVVVLVLLPFLCTPKGRVRWWCRSPWGGGHCRNPGGRTRGGGVWHKASVSDGVPLAAPIGLLPLRRGPGGGGLARGLGICVFAFGGAYWPLATAHSDPVWAQTCFGCVNGAPG